LSIEVYSTLGPGFLEDVYGEVLGNELTQREIAHEGQKEINLKHKDKDIGRNRIDFLVEEAAILERKAVDILGSSPN
jgi:GxxExxY protein